MLMTGLKKTGFAKAPALLAITMGALGAESVYADDLTANVAVYNNYVWRGLTQTANDAAVQGGIDYVSDDGWYVGTWLSNANFGANDAFSFEHDIYAGYGGEYNGFEYDVGYLYYNYDDKAEFDFGEIYGSVAYQGFSFGVNLLTNTEADEGPGQDFGFGESIYLSANYGFKIIYDLEVGLHVGWQDGDFNEAFNGVPGSYFDFNVSVAKNGFSFMVTTTDLDDAGPDDPFGNDEVRFVVGYSHEFDLKE